MSTEHNVQQDGRTFRALVLLNASPMLVTKFNHFVKVSFVFNLIAKKLTQGNDALLAVFFFFRT